MHGRSPLASVRVIGEQGASARYHDGTGSASERRAQRRAAADAQVVLQCMTAAGQPAQSRQGRRDILHVEAGDSWSQAKLRADVRPLSGAPVQLRRGPAGCQQAGRNMALGEETQQPAPGAAGAA